VFFWMLSYHNLLKSWGPLPCFLYLWEVVNEIVCVFVISQLLDEWNESYWI
jgi:hypothetical protein